MTKHVNVIDRGVVLSRPDNVFGYCAWPSVARDAEGNLVVVCSGNRIMHVCPFGKVMMVKSRDEGRTWSAPILPIDTPLDDRDAGIVHMGGGRLAVSTFNNTLEQQRNWAAEKKFGYGTDERRALSAAYIPNVREGMEEKYLGSLLSVSEDNGFRWSLPFKAPVTAPHGPNVLKNGSLIYAGVPFPNSAPGTKFPVRVYRSDNHRDFYKLADIPVCPEAPDVLHTEVHVIELPSGRLVLHIRMDEMGKPYEEKLFTICQSVSDDGGKTWSTPRLTGANGAPPHLLYHSSGTLISVYGRRKPPYGIEAMVSKDEGDNWDVGYTIWDGGRNSDLGYPASVELDNGDIFTVYYAILPGETLCSILWTRWRLI